MTHRLIAALATLALAPAAPAANPTALQPIVVTATRSPQPVSSLLSDVRVIDADILASAGSETLTELLQTYGGVEIVANGGPGQVSGVFLRGTNSNHVLVLIDGVRVNSATTGSTAFENIPVSQIQRIEILHGPASSLYGSDALGGVIQIFTRQGEGSPHFSASAGGGTYGTQRYTVGVGGESGDTRFNLQAGYHESRGFSATNEAAGFSFDPDSDPYRNSNVSLGVTQRIAEGHELALGAWGSQGDTHFDAGLGTDDVSHQRLSSFYLESRNRFAEPWLSRLKLASGSDRLQFTGAFPGFFNTQQDQFSWQNDIVAPGGNIVTGLEYRRERLDSDTAYTQTRRTTRSEFAGYSGEWNGHLLQASARHDDVSHFGARNTGSFAYGYRLTPALRVTANIASAFKAPSFNDLYFPNTFGFSGNPDLKPERALNWEAAAYYDQGGQHVGLTLFSNRIRDLIAIDPSFTTLINVNEASIRGTTLSFAGSLGSSRVTLEATHESPEDIATGNQLPRRARNFGSGSIVQPWGAWQLGGELVVSGARFDRLANTPDTRLGGYGLLNLLAQYRLSTEVSLRARWNNVFDRRYELAQGFNTPGSNLFIAIDYHPRQF